jgi:Flp pilus assembly protein TadG
MMIFSMLIVLVLAGLVLDEGGAMADKVRILDVAQGAARSGAREIDLGTLRSTGQVRLKPTAATAAAQRFLTSAGLSGTATASATTVTVTVSATRRTQLLHLVGVSSIPISATGTATAATAP